MEKIIVNLARCHYPVWIGDDALARVPSIAPPSVAVISNPTVLSLYGEKLLKTLQAAGKQPLVITVADGEQYKNIDSLSYIIDELTTAQLGRDGGIIALGGGVIGDLAGFAAAIYMRGIPLLQLPTTLLAQVDAAIGGKTGINHPKGKNLIGAFYQPQAVFCDTRVLTSLPERDYRAGLAEVVKYGLLGDADFFQWLEDNCHAIQARDATTVAHLVSVSVNTKAQIVMADEQELSGQRALLNLGHTFAHAIETLSGYGHWLHGEAVAIGLVAAAHLSESVCDFPADSTQRIIRLLKQLGLPVQLTTPIADRDWLAAMALDKKNKAMNKQFILMRNIGDTLMQPVSDTPIRQALALIQ